MDDMRAYAMSGPFQLGELAADRILEEDHVLFLPGTGSNKKRKTLSEINDIRMVAGLRGLALLGKRDWVYVCVCVFSALLTAFFSALFSIFKEYPILLLVHKCEKSSLTNVPSPN